MKNIKLVENDPKFQTIESVNEANPNRIYVLGGKVLTLFISLISVRPIGISLRFGGYSSAESLIHHVLHKLMIWLEINPQILLITDFVYEITMIAFAVVAFIEVTEEILVKIKEILERPKE